MRPQQWIKNLFIFVPIFFAKEIFIPDKLITTALAFLAFCAVASAMYIINDIADIQQDSDHPQKKSRPLASGAIKIWQALLLCAVLIAAAILIAGFWLPQILGILGLYAVLNLLYSLWLKHVVIFDILLISGFYLIRVITGGLALDIPISRWLILCAIFVSLFIIIGKRRAEFRQANQREVLKNYSSELLEYLTVISATLTIVAYGLYSVIGTTSPLAVYSIFFVLLGIFRYLYMIYTSAEAEFPEKIIFTDKIILGSLVGWVVYMYFVFYI